MDRRYGILSIIGDLGFGGAENRLLTLARNINRDRFRHTVLLLNDISQKHDPGGMSMRRHFEDAGVEVIQLPASNCGKLSRLSRRLRAICEYVQQERIDLIDAHCESAALLAALAGVLTGTRRVATLYHPQPLQSPRFWGIAQQFLLTNIDAVISDSAIRGHQIQEATLLKCPELLVVPNGAAPPQPS